MTNFHKISHGAYCGRDNDNLFKWFRNIKQDGPMPIYSKKKKTLKIFSRLKWVILVSVITETVWHKFSKLNNTEGINGPEWDGQCDNSLSTTFYALFTTGCTEARSYDDEGFSSNDKSTHDGNLHQRGILIWFSLKWLKNNKLGIHEGIKLKNVKIKIDIFC